MGTVDFDYHLDVGRFPWFQASDHEHSWSLRADSFYHNTKIHCLLCKAGFPEVKWYFQGVKSYELTRVIDPFNLWDLMVAFGYCKWRGSSVSKYDLLK